MEFYKAYLDVPLSERLERTKRLLNKYPNRVPIIIDRFKPDDPDVKQHKFLLETDMLIPQFVYLLRKNLTNKLGPEFAIFLFDKNLYLFCLLILFKLKRISCIIQYWIQ
jgi:GABA(A) receptor-associated protein